MDGAAGAPRDAFPSGARERSIYRRTAMRFVPHHILQAGSPCHASRHRRITTTFVALLAIIMILPAMRLMKDSCRGSLACKLRLDMSN